MNALLLRMKNAQPLRIRKVWRLIWSIALLSVCALISPAFGTNDMAQADPANKTAVPSMFTGSSGAARCGCIAAGDPAVGRATCSVAEWESICHVQFDLFDKNKASDSAKFIETIWARKIAVPDLRVDEPTGWQILEDRNLVKYLFVYFGISLRNIAEKENTTEEIRLMLDTLYKNASLVSSRFLSMTLPPVQRSGIFITHGCVEYESTELRAMYKASWSRVATKRRCR
jgi:hypothetical protein